MKTTRALAVGRSIVGCALLPLYHLPRLVGLGLAWSYSYVFQRHENLTADPREHLRRARRLLKGPNSVLLYAALELRLALERMADHEIRLAEGVSRKTLKDEDPTKHVAAAIGIAPESRYPQDIYIVDPHTGIRYPYGQYRPMDKAVVSRYDGKLGDLLHATYGLHLGVYNDPWYTSARQFLGEVCAWMDETLTDNESFFAYHGFDNVEMERRSAKAAPKQ